MNSLKTQLIFGAKFMTRLNRKLYHLGLLALVGTGLAACSGGLDGGSIVSRFVGITDVKVLGPETVEVNWPVSSTCNSYKVYQLSSSTSESVATVSVPPTKIKTPIIESDRSYTFAVGCIDDTPNPSGLNFTKSFTTWPKFNGVVTSTLDNTGTNPLINLKWNYSTVQGVAFEVYAKESTIPGDLATWGLTQPGGYATPYSETPVCMSYNNEIKIGVGGDCNPAGINTGSIYNFKIVAKYPDGSHSSDIIGNGTSILMPSTFTAPSCILTRQGLGAESANSYLFLRCTSSVTAGGCPMASISTTAYQAINGVRTVVSDTMNGAGTLRIQPKIAVNAANDRLVQNLEIEYTCKSTTPYTKSIARYDGTTPQLKSPSLKYASGGYETAPVQSYAEHPSFLGSSVVIGDFNCDGKPDMAVGLPRISYTLAPYLNQNSESGAVKIYYDYTISATGGIVATNTQYLSFRDLPTNAHFGQSIAVGNINKDVYNDSAASKFFACEDLIIGAPGTSSNSGYTGTGYIFFGQPQGFPQPLDSAGLPANAPTCSGTIVNQVCSPVRLQPDVVNDFKIAANMTQQNNQFMYNSGTISQLGASVAYVRDFNADGYGDVAIGDPMCRWDGEAMNNFIPPGTIAPPPPTDVGCVYVYWGGPSGLQTVNVGKTPQGTAVLNASYVKIYPPIPQAGMHFGASISGGGDVDGRMPVPVAQNGGSGIILANGDDFIVGAPDFKYSYTSPEIGQGLQLPWFANDSTLIQSCDVTAGGNCPVDPVVLQGPPGYDDVNKYYENKITPPWNGAWSPNLWDNTIGFPSPANSALRGSTGIAFLYLGRYALKSYDLDIIRNTSSPTSNLTLYPNGATNLPVAPAYIEDLLSMNLHDRQNGSPYLTTKLPITTDNAPVSAFYNCGNRGGPRTPLNGKYKHISCLAGRNNFSVIYPTLSPGGPAVSRFGANLAIGGTKEQNAVALYQLGSNVSASAYKSVTPTGANSNLLPLSQGNTHERIRGSSLWELGVRGLNAPGAKDAVCETTIDPRNAPFFVPGNCSSSYSGRLARSIVEESYSFPSTTWNPAPNALPLTDINKDGYADVVVSANSQVFTYFGNYAADFSYQGNSFSTSATCNINRSTTNLTGYAFTTSRPASTPSPYSTFFSRASILTPPAYTITGQYPQYVLPPTGQYSRLSYLDDTGETSGGSTFNYGYQSINRAAPNTSFAASICLPQVKTYSVTPTAIAVADLNADGIVDLAIGFSGANASSGQQVISLAGQNATGIALDMTYTISAPSAKLGSSVAATNWKFVDETSRRDVASGAVGYGNGAGALYTFSGSGSATINPVYSYQFTEDSNTPSALGLERSRIIGDINGDGYDDLFVPVKRFGAGGSIFYDAIIYYGSSFGPVTYSFCMSKASTMKSFGGGAVSSSECLGSTLSQAVLLNSAQIRLPQYIPRPTGAGPYWAKAVFPAGDVNRDGYQDVISLDGAVQDDVGAGGLAGSLYLFFGSSSGFINGPPVLGTSTNQSPQLVTANQEFVGAGSNSAGAGKSSWSNISSAQGVTHETAYPIVHGDFNGDGFEDLALGAPGGTSPATSENSGFWTCSAADSSYRPGYCPNPLLPPANPPPFFTSSIPSQGVGNVGYVMIFYGGSGGYQTPINPSTGVPAEFDSIKSKCFNNYSSCTYSATAGPSLPSISLVYGSLAFDTGTNSYSLDTTKTACDSGSGIGNSAYACKASLIRAPIFSDSAKGGNWDFPRDGFGNTLEVADINHDGIDDLIVGQPKADFTALLNLQTGNAAVYGPSSLYGGNVDTYGHGTTYIYYGAKGAGVVAPNANGMLGDAGLGVMNTSVDARAGAAVFQIYPYLANPLPPLDVTEAGRGFGTGMSAGDFNGDGYDDLAVASGNSQIYVYYGPICQADNTKLNWQVVHANVNIAKEYDALMLDPPPNPSTCTLLNLNGNFPGNTVTQISNVSGFTKTLHPQMISMPGSSRASAMGSTLLSARPSRSVASTVVLKNTGNINGDPEGTSDLVIGTSFMNDPNVFATNTGLAYILSGHKTFSAGEMPTTPGLYVSASATYNGNIISQVINGTTYYYYTPIILKPHAADGSIGSFFLYKASLGDLNGDGTADLMMPTKKIPYGANGTTVIDGGGFKLFY